MSASLTPLPMTTKCCLRRPHSETVISSEQGIKSDAMPGTLDLHGLCVWMQGLEVFKEEHGRYPDLVVLHSNYWDVAQIVLFREDDRKEHAYGPLMKAWLANAEKVGTFLQVINFPMSAYILSQSSAQKVYRGLGIQPYRQQHVGMRQSPGNN